MISGMKDIYHVLFKRPKILFLSCLAALVFWLILYTLFSGYYVARAKILITDTTAEGRNSNRALRTTIEVLKSRFLMEEVVKELNLEGAFGKTGAVDKLLAAVNAAPVKDTDVIEISVRLKKPQLATHIANAVCKVIVTDSARQQLSFEKDILEWVLEKSADIRKELESAAERLREFKKSAGTANLAAEHEAMWIRIEGLRAELAAAKAQRQNAEAVYSEIKKYLEAGTAPEEIPYVQNGIEYRKMLLAYKDYNEKKQQLMETYQPSHPSVVEIDDKLSRLKSAMAGRAREIIDASRQEYEIPKDKEENISKLIKTENDALLKLEERLDEYNTLVSDIKEREIAYNTFLNGIEEEFSPGSIKIRKAELIEQAYLPAKKEGPPLALMVFIGLVSGLILSTAYNMRKDGETTSLRKQEKPGLKDRGMYIERVKEQGE